MHAVIAATCCQLENTNDSVMAREERNREGNKQLRQKTREINQLLAENASLRRDLKERDDDLQELAVCSLRARRHSKRPRTWPELPLISERARLSLSFARVV